MSATMSLFMLGVRGRLAEAGTSLSEMAVTYRFGLLSLAGQLETPLKGACCRLVMQSTKIKALVD